MPYKDKLKQKESHRLWHKRNRERILEEQRKKRESSRIIVLKYYSNGDIKCSCCGERNIEFLSIDHINGKGTKHRKEINNYPFTLWLIKNNFPSGFRILCHNCNQSLGHYGRCPHQKTKRD